jgi:hypothetical protein
MIKEVTTHGRLLNIEAAVSLAKPGNAGKPLSAEQASVAITSDNFDPNNPDKRPPGWKAIRYRRVLAKEDNPSPDFMFEDGALEKIEKVCGYLQIQYLY